VLRPRSTIIRAGRPAGEQPRLEGGDPARIADLIRTFA
jgi:hypothetical protein